jgi:transposase
MQLIFDTIYVIPRIFWLTSRGIYGVIMVTHMARRRSDGAADPKVAALRAAGALHPHPEAVHDDAFLRHPFFDPRDRVQVKYEMLRRHRVDGQPVTQVAASFSISRQAFYEALTAFTAMGLPGLVPKRPGPKRAHKCTDAILDFAERWQTDAQEPSAAGVAAAIRQQFHVTIHPRSLQRALDRRKKKRHALETSR